MKLKPLFGEPCNGCGICCYASQCPLSVALYGPVPVCPAIRPREGGGIDCGLLEKGPKKINGRKIVLEGWKEAVALMIGAGIGCDCTRTDADAIARESALPGMREKAKAAIRALSPKAAAIFLTVRGASPPW